MLYQSFHSDEPAKHLAIQRIYHRNADGTMSYYDRFAGTMTYHPTHGHMHSDEWGVFTLRVQDPDDPNPLNWPIVSNGAKMGFCLMDYNDCGDNAAYGHCRDENRYSADYLEDYPEIAAQGFDGGTIDFSSSRIGSITKSKLIIDNFKVQEVPILAKILTLASLQGIADLLTGEGIRFTDFEMIYSKKGKLTTIDEIYSIGPAISIMMDGYIEEEKLVSLRGTLVPATTINRTISSIPLIGDILVGKKVGEGVFGVSFKIKGNPKNLKTTVNPIKTLTPRFITRTLENIKKN